MDKVIPKKSLGQHWLRDDKTLTKICEHAEIEVGDFVIEVGPGLGTLTTKLLDAGADVTAIEFDELLAKKLDEQKLSEKLKVINQDILKFNFENQPKKYKIVANIPYYLTGRLLRILTDSVNKPELIVLLVQKEVAQRVCAKAGSMSSLSVWAQMYFDCSLGIEVPAELFDPAPKIDSQVVILRLLKNSQFEESNKKILTQIISHGFNSKRKTLHNSLASGLSLEKKEVELILQKTKLPNNTRPQQLTLSQWGQLAKNFTKSLKQV